MNEEIESCTVYIISSENKNMAEYFMKANTYAKPVLRKPTGAIVRIIKTTLCGTDIHIIK